MQTCTIHQEMPHSRVLIYSIDKNQTLHEIFLPITEEPLQLFAGLSWEVFWGTIPNYSECPATLYFVTHPLHYYSDADSLFTALHLRRIGSAASTTAARLIISTLSYVRDSWISANCPSVQSDACGKPWCAVVSHETPCLCLFLSLSEMWYWVFLWCLFTSLFVHGVVGLLMLVMLQRHKRGRLITLVLVSVGFLASLSGGVITSESSYSTFFCLTLYPVSRKKK